MIAILPMRGLKAPIPKIAQQAAVRESKDDMLLNYTKNDVVAASIC